MLVMPQMLPPQQKMQVGICGETCDREADHQNEDMLPRGLRFAHSRKESSLSRESSESVPSPEVI